MKTVALLVADAAPGERLRIVGAWRRGARDCLVDSIEVRPSDAPPAGR